MHRPKVSFGQDEGRPFRALVVFGVLRDLHEVASVGSHREQFVDPRAPSEALSRRRSAARPGGSVLEPGGWLLVAFSAGEDTPIYAPFADLERLLGAPLQAPPTDRALGAALSA